MHEEPPPPAPDAMLGQVVDSRYRIDRILGSGGMGTVYQAEHLTTHKPYAIKIMHSQLLSDDKALKRFDREARAISAIDHPHVVEVYDYGQTPEGVPFLVMEYLEGTTLGTYLKEIPGNGLPLSQAVVVAMQAAQALQHVHERGIVHRDIKPDNIQLAINDEKTFFAKLFDFGIARIENQAAVTQVMAGPPSTLAYAAPEIHLRSDYLSPAIDVYALGVTLFEMLTKQRPFVGDGLEVVWSHMKDAPPRLSHYRKDVKIPNRLEELTAQMLAKEPAQRPTMAQVADLLAMISTELPPVSALGLHALRTYVLPNKQPNRPPGSPPPLPGTAKGPPRTASQEIAAVRDVDLIESQREQLSTQLEQECTAMIERYWPQGAPAELVPLLSRCVQTEMTKSDLEMDLALLQDELGQQKAVLRAGRNVLRQQLQARRDELRALPVGNDPVRRQLAEGLAELERAYAAPEPANVNAERVQREETRRQQLRSELMEAQRALADQLLRVVVEMPSPGKTGSGPRMDLKLSAFAKRLAVALSQLDSLNASLQ